MKHLKTSNHSSLDGDDYLSTHGTSTMYSHYHSSNSSLNNISINSHDFELRKRDMESQHKKHRFFHKRKTKDNHSKPLIYQQFNDEDHSLSTTTSFRAKSSEQFFGRPLNELIVKYNNQLPPIIQVDLNCLSIRVDFSFVYFSATI